MTIERANDEGQLSDAPEPSAAYCEPDADLAVLPTIAQLHEELRQMQQALAESRKNEQLFAGVIESAMDAIIAVDENYRVVLFNPRAELMFGLSTGAALGQPLEVLLPAGFRREHAERIRAFANSGMPHGYAIAPRYARGRRMDGELFPIEASVSQITVQGHRLFTVILRDISQRMHDEQALRESEDRLALFAATTFEGIVVSERGRILDCNEQFARMLGYTTEEVVGLLIVDLVDPGDRERVAENLRHGRDSIAEHAMLCKDGGRIIVEAHGRTTPTGDPDGRRCTVVRDITERKQTEQALREQTERYELVLAGAQSAIWDWDVSSQRVHYSAQWKAMRGLSDDEVDDHQDIWSGSIFAGDAPRVLASIQAHVDGKTAVFAEEYRIHCKDGSLKWIAGRGIAQRDASGQVIRMAGSDSDITERKRIEQALRESQADLNRAQSVGQIGSWRLNIHRNQLLWSDESYRIYGIPQGLPLTYDIFLSAVHPDDREYVDRMWMAALEGAPYDIEHRIVVGGKVKWVREKAELEVDERGHVLGGFGTTQDITSLKQAEQALMEADQRKDAFLAMLAHELRNPLTPIRNAAHVLGHLETGEPRVRWAQQIIERQVDYLTRLVDDLLDVSRIVRDKVALKIARVELATVVDQALVMARPLIDAMEHRVEISLPPHPVLLEGDSVRLAQVLLNLLDNAAKYTPKGGKIDMAASVIGPVIEIKLRDNGVGIPPELLPQIFDLFQQGERTLDRSQGGLGIGLTLAKRLVEMHGGLLEAYSAGAGHGTEFTIWLPAQMGVSASVQSETHTADAPAPCRVVVVDDDPAVADSMAVLLEIKGHEVRTAATGEAALDLVQRFRPRVVLLDIGLQGMDGYEVAQKLRSRGEAGNIYLIAVTGYDDEIARARSLAAGFDRHLVKPVSPATIYQLLAENCRCHALD